ncbi:nucleoprotein TPR isoform X2 [Nematostella vectensis]|uniref:nucleoprotein TPR isoform X2 n=1 Tax=Nematostella vectensis TaxID=45351 RepID=UPI00207720BC|nr:nucleoprotein TPR isoform X2 [Nematostella vectensis]
MAATMDTAHESDLQSFLSLHLSVPKVSVDEIASSSDEAAQFLVKVKDYVQEQAKLQAKWRTDMTGLRRARVNAEQQFSQIEKQLITCNTKLDTEMKQHVRAKTELEETKTALIEKQKRLQEVEGIKEDAFTNYTRVSKINEQLEADKLELLSTLERKNNEIQNLNVEWNTMSEKLSAANIAKCKAEAALDDIESQGTSFKIREKRMDQEKVLLQKQNESLSAELKAKTEELATIRKEKSGQVLQLRSQLETSNEELKSLKEFQEDLKATNGELEKKVKSFMERLRESRDQLAKSEEHFKNELASQSRLADLYKDESEESKKRAKEMQTAMDELQKLLKEAVDARLATEARIQEMEFSHVEVVKDLESKVHALETELNNANDLLEAARQRGAAPMSEEMLSTLSPTAAATSSLLKSGMTLTEIYSQYVEVSDALQREKLENTRLNNYMDQILKEIEEKAPLLQQQKIDYERALHSVDGLTRRLDAARMENEKLLVSSEDARKMSNHLRRENERLKTSITDLSQQVQVLLKECEEARGGLVSTTEESVAEVSSSSQVISKHLVTFKTIEELQQQNQKLLAVVRELSEEKEKKEMEGTEHKLAELKSQLEISLKEVEHMKDARARQMTMVESVVRQRDMYRVLLANTGQSPIPLSGLDDASLIPTPSTPDKSMAAMEETREALKQMQKHFTDFRAEKKQEEANMRSRYEDLQSENTRLLGEKAMLKSQLEFSEEKYKMLQSNAEGFKKEANAASDKAHKLNLANAKIQLTIDGLQHNLIEAKEKLVKIEETCETLQAEKDMLRNSEMMLMQENKTLLQQHKDQSSLLVNLQSLQNKLERSEFETRTRLEGQVEALQKESNLAKRQLEMDNTHHKNLIKTLENRVQELQTQIDTESRSNQQARDMLVRNTKEMERLEFKNTEVKAQLEAAEKRVHELLSKEPNSDQDIDKMRKETEEKFKTDLQDTELKLKDAEAKIKDLETQLEQAKLHAEQFKSMSGANDEALREVNKSTEEFKSNMESQVRAAKEQASFLQGQVQGLEINNSNLTVENSKLKRESERQIKELQEILGTLRKELDEAHNQARSACANELVAMEELREQTKIASECQEKYERELMLHAKDVQALSDAKEELAGHNDRLTEAVDRAVSAEQKLQTLQNAVDGQRKEHEKAIEKLQSRCADLVDQNSNLHKQLERLVNQMASSKKTSLSTSDMPASSADDSSEASKGIEDLWEIVRFSRRELEIAETKCELAQTESLRYQQRSEFLEKQLKTAQASLQEEASQADIDAQSTTLELAEANKILNDEKQKLEQEMKAMEGKIKKMDAELQSVKDANRNLTSSKDSMLAEKNAMKSEIMRWSTKTNQLMEQYRNVDPDEYKRMTEEKKQFQQHVASLKSESQRSKTLLENVRNELTKTKAELTKVQAELLNVKNDQQKAQSQMEAIKSQSTSVEGKNQAEVDALKKSLEEKTEEMNEKIKTLNQVKRIARRYKTQFDEQSKEFNEVKKKLEDLRKAPPTPSQPASAPADTAGPAAEGSDASPYQTKIKELEEQVKLLQSEVQGHEEQVSTLKKAEDQSKAQVKEKEEKSKKVLIQAREKIQQLTALKDKLSAENEDLRKMAKAASEAKESLSQRSSELEMRLSVLQSQYESRLAKIEKELTEAKAEKEMTEKSKAELEELQQKEKAEMEQLQQKLQQQQKQIQQQIQQQQMRLTSLTTTTSSTTRPQGDTAGPDNSQQPEIAAVIATPISSVPPTATIKPTTTPTSIKPSAAKTASIRPMAIPQHITPTATVLPTVTSTAQDTPTSTTAIVHPRGQAYAVSTVAASSQVSVQPVMSTPEIVVGGSIETLTAEAESEGGAGGQDSPAEQETITVPSTSSGKRQREEEQESERTSTQVLEKEPTSKKLKTTEAVETEAGAEAGQWEVPEMEMNAAVGRESPEVVLIESDDGEDDEEVDEEMDDEEGEEMMEDEDEEADKGDEEEEEEGDVEEEEDEEEDEIEEEDYDEDIGDDDDLEEEAEEVAERKAPAVVDVVEVIDEDECVEEEETQPTVEDEEEEKEEEVAGLEEEEGTSGEVPGEAVEQEVAGIMEDASNSQQAEVSRENVSVSPAIRGLTPTISSSSQFASQQEEPATSGRLSASDRSGRLRSHLAPFSFPPGQSAPGPFDEADDCTVPSTPTLFVPKRTDGFAEAIRYGQCFSYPNAPTVLLKL